MQVQPQILAKFDKQINKNSITINKYFSQEFSRICACVGNMGYSYTRRALGMLRHLAESLK